MRLCNAAEKSKIIPVLGYYTKSPGKTWDFFIPFGKGDCHRDTCTASFGETQKIYKHSLCLLWRINLRFLCASVLLWQFNFAKAKCYCVSDILTCKPALVFTVGALDEI